MSIKPRLIVRPLNLRSLKTNLDNKHVHEVKEANSPNEIVSGLFLSSFKIATDIDKLRELKIKGIINVTKDIPLYHTNTEIEYLQIPIHDNCETNIIDYFEQAHVFIEKHLLKGNSILVHCHAGISRSATIVISYIMNKTKKSWTESLQLVKEKRIKIDPNLNFIGQLIMFESKILL